MKVRILPEAQQDLGIAADYYELQMEGLGVRFLRELVFEISQLAVHGGVHRLKHEFHFKVSRRFPFGIYYLVENGQVDVYAVVDCRQDPARTIDRLSDQ